jgi:hypothetical protein
MKNQLFHDIALEVGGSHYPDVGGELLETYGRHVVEECLRAINEADKRHVYTTFDLGQHECSLDAAKSAIKARFNI